VALSSAGLVPAQPARGQVAPPVGHPQLSKAKECCSIVPALTEVSIEVLELLDSQRSRTGYKFRIRLHESVNVDGATVIPAGVGGEGEIVHAGKAGFGGKAGELLLAARFLEFEGKRIPLRSFKLGVVTGGSPSFGSKLAKGIFTGGAAAAMSPGYPVQITPGTLGIAKLSLAFDHCMS
jgi:hypothetical protein